MFWITFTHNRTLYLCKQNQKVCLKVCNFQSSIKSEHPVGCNAHPKDKLQLDYRSPEMVHKENRKGYHFKTDVWYGIEKIIYKLWSMMNRKKFDLFFYEIIRSAGCSLHELINLEKTFNKKETEKVREAILNEHPANLKYFHIFEPLMRM